MDGSIWTDLHMLVRYPHHHYQPNPLDFFVIIRGENASKFILYQHIHKLCVSMINCLIIKQLLLWLSKLNYCSPYQYSSNTLNCGNNNNNSINIKSNRKAKKKKKMMCMYSVQLTHFARKCTIVGQKLISSPLEAIIIVITAFVASKR